MSALKRVLLVGCVLTALATLAMWRLSRADLGNVEVVVASHGTNEAGVRFAILQVTNPGPYRIALPGLILVQPRGASKAVPNPAKMLVPPPNLSTMVAIPGTDFWLEPGKAREISVPAPASSIEWRANVDYYAYSPWNRVKMALSASRFGPKLPDILVTVQSREVSSPWIGQ